MYLTAGLYNRRKIEVPKGVKPTLSKVRQGVFNVLFNLADSNSTFLDMFAGSGIMGLEAVSRGYKVKELEISKDNFRIIKKNYASLNLKADISLCDSLKYQKEKFDIVYADPPWDMDYLPVIKKGCELLFDKGILVIEFDEYKKMDVKKMLDENNIPFTVVKEKKYGRCLVSFLKKD